MARISCSCGGPIVSGEGYEVCVRCSDTRRVQGWRQVTPVESEARELVVVGLHEEMTRERFEEAP